MRTTQIDYRGPVIGEFFDVIADAARRKIRGPNTKAGKLSPEDHHKTFPDDRCVINVGNTIVRVESAETLLKPATRRGLIFTLYGEGFARADQKLGPYIQQIENELAAPKQDGDAAILPSEAVPLAKRPRNDATAITSIASPTNEASAPSPGHPSKRHRRTKVEMMYAKAAEEIVVTAHQFTQTQKINVLDPASEQRTIVQAAIAQLQTVIKKAGIETVTPRQLLAGARAFLELGNPGNPQYDAYLMLRARLYGETDRAIVKKYPGIENADPKGARNAIFKLVTDSIRNAGPSR